MTRFISLIRPAASYLMITWMLVIITLSSVPNVQTFKIHTQHSDIRLDYLMHFTQYGILAFFTILTVAGRELRISSWRYLLTVVCLILFAGADEFHQKLIPGRSFSIYDIMSNVSGIVVASMGTVGIVRYIKRNQR